MPVDLKPYCPNHLIISSLFHKLLLEYFIYQVLCNDAKNIEQLLPSVALAPTL